jgi:hypothetical protein
MVKGALGTDPEGNQVGIIKNQNPSNQRSSKIGTRTPSGRSAKKAGKKSSSSKKKQSRTKKKSRKKH